ncbi:MAG TPA: protein translocase subunit SecF [bacterium]|nr:protein translocase subunit SecF [bacterium]HPL95198.1 protein translocase subunit SecF [bacterium]
MHLAIVKNRNKFFIFSGVLVILSIISIAVWGLNFGIDFTGGSLLEIKINNAELMSASDFSNKITTLMPTLGEVRVQPSSDGGYLIRLKHLSEEEHQQLLRMATEIFNDQNKDVQIEEKRFESIGPVIGQELKVKAVWAIILAMIMIILYIAYSFRHVSKPVASWKYGVGAVIALFHDIIIVTGIFAALGHFFGYEIDLLFVSALLTILGFSVHDTIVVYDRTRENLIHNPQKTFEDTVDKATNDTITRSINTSLTVFFVLLAMYLLGGDSTRNFVLALLIGVFFGTYSSIFVASTLLVVWHKLGLKKK